MRQEPTPRSLRENGLTKSVFIPHSGICQQRIFGVENYEIMGWVDQPVT
jgi:hypothetical protein